MSNRFFLPQTIPASTQLRCWLLNKIDQLVVRCGGVIHIPGNEFEVPWALLQFRNFKDIFDQTVAQKSGYRSISSHTKAFDYFLHMLPGLHYEIEDPMVYQSVDPEYVIGCSWRGYEPPQNAKEIIEKLNSAKREDINRASYLQLEELPFFIAGEGNNRVELFRRYRQKINADIRRITITSTPIIVRNMRGDRWLASSINEQGRRTFVTVPVPSIALPIYRMLGTKIVPIRVPVNEDDVEESFASSIDQITEAVAFA